MTRKFRVRSARNAEQLLVSYTSTVVSSNSAAPLVLSKALYVSAWLRHLLPNSLQKLVERIKSSAASTRMARSSSPEHSRTVSTIQSHGKPEVSYRIHITIDYISNPISSLISTIPVVYLIDMQIAPATTVPSLLPPYIPLSRTQLESLSSRVRVA
jgi:hypothetical protein